jgi:DNA-binding response OmpR family regulator
MDSLPCNADGRDDQTKPLRVLVVDGNRDAADSTAMLLRLYGYQTIPAYTAASGLELARLFRPHVVLSELILGDLDGCGLARLLRHELPQAALVALTGRGAERDRIRSGEAGFSYHLVKPAAIDLLMGVLTRAGVTATTGP